MHWPNFARLATYFAVAVLSALSLVPYFRLKSTISHDNSDFSTRSSLPGAAFASAGIVAGLWTAITLPIMYILSFFVRKTMVAFVVEFVCLIIAWVFWIVAMGMTARESHTISQTCTSSFNPLDGDTGDVCSWVHLTEKLSIIIFILLSVYLAILLFIARGLVKYKVQDPLAIADEEHSLQGTCNLALPAPAYSLSSHAMKDLSDKPPIYSAK